MDIESAIIARQAILQQNVALAMIKQAAGMQKQIADILAVAASGRGAQVDLTA